MTSEAGPEGRPQSDVARKEEATLAVWKAGRFFERSVEKDAPKGEYVFYDGPPFANGLPHYGHILSSAIKDMVPRYKTMQGYRVRRVWGWDCHGLPIESVVEKDLKVAGKKNIEQHAKYTTPWGKELTGIAAFNEYARTKVLGYVHEWERTVERIGRWVNFEGSYKTMDNSYIESVWWALSDMHSKGDVYEGTRVLPYCPRCETPLANSEIAMDNSYRDVTENAIHALFPIKDVEKVPELATLGTAVSLVAWTTTPWTLPGNLALAVNPALQYVAVSDDKHAVIVEKTLYETHLDRFPGRVVCALEGGKLVGLSYEPLFEELAAYIKQAAPHAHTESHLFKVYAADFVTNQAGTGIVHIAPAYGEDDWRLAKEYGLPVAHHVDIDGKYMKDRVPADLAGALVKKRNEDTGTDAKIIAALTEKGKVFGVEPHTHSYPFCYRCETPLVYYAVDSWFVGIQKHKQTMLALNEHIQWVPDHLKHGRFAHSMENAPDWNISRNRFWASPLPFWKCDKTGKVEVISSLKALRAKTSRGNTFVFIRHGQAEHNVKNILSGVFDGPYHLTDRGKEQVVAAVQKVKSLKLSPTVLYASPFVRAQESAALMSKELGLDASLIKSDERLREVGFGDFNGSEAKVYHEWRKGIAPAEQLYARIPNGESYADIRSRVGAFLYEADAAHENAVILVVGHETPLWMAESVAGDMSCDEAMARRASVDGDYFPNGDVRVYQFAAVPHNDLYELDLHRPYIDSIIWPSDAGGMMRRVPEVIDCWFESGSMPFASVAYHPEYGRGGTTDTGCHQNGYFEKHFPGHFVSEYIAQTRTWFYYMHAVSTMLFGKEPFTNVVTTGTVLAEDGQKMSKSKDNFPDPWKLFDKFGVDALRYYLLASPLMKAEDLNFSDRDVDTIYKRNILRLDNVASFYDMYADKTAEMSATSDDVLDRWIVARVEELTRSMTSALDRYEIDEALRPIDLFIDDLSTWYVRRSRDRIKADETSKVTSATLRFVLYRLSHLLAPIMPFIAERLFMVVRSDTDAESVHLSKWPKAETSMSASHAEIVSAMTTVRAATAQALLLRTEAGIKIRQPLASLTIPEAQGIHDQALLDTIADEVNVKKIELSSSIDKVVLDTIITNALRAEGVYRDMLRQVQDARKQAGLVPGQRARVTLPNSYDKAVVDMFRKEFLEAATLADIGYDDIESPVAAAA